MCNLEHYGRHFNMTVSLMNTEEILKTKVPNCLQQYLLIFTKSALRLDYIQKFSVKFTDKRLYLLYSYQYVNVIYRNNRHFRESHETHKHMCEQCKVFVVTAVSRYRTELQNEYHILSPLKVAFLIMSGKGKNPLYVGTKKYVDRYSEH